jgi:hypothetical protein
MINTAAAHHFVPPATMMGASAGHVYCIMVKFYTEKKYHNS